MTTIKVLIADDQKYVREGFRMILELEDDMEVVAIAENGQIACQLIEAVLPDVVLMDIQMPVLDGLEALRYIHANFPRTKVIILTTFAEADYILEGLSEGAHGYVLKDMDADKLIASIREVMAGQFILPATIASTLAASVRELKRTGAVERRRQTVSRLTFRESELAMLLIEGLSNREIANTMCITEGTARNYISNLYSKLGVEDRAKAIILLQTLI